MNAIQTLLPVLLLIGLGWALTTVKFLGRDFIGQLNKLTFYVALPAFIVRSIAEVSVPPGEALGLFLLLLACTVGAMIFAMVLSFFTGVRPAAIGSVAQSAFRGNLAYAGLPVITFALASADSAATQSTIGTALLVFGPMTAVFNLLAVLCLQKVSEWGHWRGWARSVRAIVTNPLIIACLGGFFLSVSGVPIPGPLDRALAALGGAALPVALLCIGGTLSHIETGGRYRAIGIAVGTKVIFLPVLAWALCVWWGVEGDLRLIVMVFAGAPTAVAAYTMAAQMEGDETVTSAAIAISTICSMGTLALILWLLP